MKFSILTLAVSLISVNALADLPIKACYMDSDKKIGVYQTQITVTSGYVAVVYVSQKVSGLGGYTGTIYSTPVVRDGSVSLKDLTLNDGDDGYLDDMNLEITPETVLFAEKDAKEKPKERVECWPRK